MIIGICGGTGSGKTLFASNLIQAIGANNICVLPLDSYYLDQSHIIPQERILVNFDHPKMIDFSLFNKHISDLQNGIIVEKPIYNFQTHTIISTEKVLPKKIILAEGVLLFQNPVFSNICDVKIFIKINSNIRLFRRIKRDQRERGRSIISIIRQYKSTVQPMYKKYVGPYSEKADIVVKNGGNSKKAISEIIELLKKM